MKPQYSELTIYVSGDENDSIELHTNTLEGSRSVVELKSGEEDKKSLGFYNIEQLINALETIRDCKFRYFSEDDQ